MLMTFIGKPDSRFPQLVTGKTYDIIVETRRWGFMDFVLGKSHPQIISPIMCPYENWATFYQNWKRAPFLLRFGHANGFVTKRQLSNYPPDYRHDND